MQFLFNLKRNFFHTFQEMFVYHHNSLNFRAKVFALLIAADENPSVENFIIVKNYGLEVYNDEKRAMLLMLATKEYVQKVKDDNGLYLDTLVVHIQKELQDVPRYANKIDLEALKPLLELPKDKDTRAYQKNIMEFLAKLKEETLERNSE